MMDLPAEFSGRVYKTKLKGLISDFKKMNQIQKDWPGSEIDVVFENSGPVVVLVFESREDCLAFNLKYGDNYV